MDLNKSILDGEASFGKTNKYAFVGIRTVGEA